MNTTKTTPTSSSETKNLNGETVKIWYETFWVPKCKIPICGHNPNERELSLGEKRQWELEGNKCWKCGSESMGYRKMQRLCVSHHICYQCPVEKVSLIYNSYVASNRDFMCKKCGRCLVTPEHVYSRLMARTGFVCRFGSKKRSEERQDEIWSQVRAALLEANFKKEK